MFTLILAPLALASGEASSSTYGLCVHCHGVHGEGRPELGTPRIGDLDAGYVETQLRAFRDGTRGAHPDDTTALPMVQIARSTKAADLGALAATVEALEPEHRSAGPGNSQGAGLYAPCVACHGADARGNPALGAPDLLFQDGTYLKRQLTHYRDGRRGTAGAPPLAIAMAGMAAKLSDVDIDALVAHIASLRPERPPVETYEVSLSEAEGLAAFTDIYAVATHPRCLNCHPDGDAPLHTDASVPHDFGITRFSPLQGTPCNTCHAPAPVGDGKAPLPPADPVWSMAPAQMVFQGRTPQQLCEQLKDPERNGGRGSIASTRHIAEDHLLQTSWHSGRTPPPISHAALVERFETWGRAGSPCPTD